MPTARYQTQYTTTSCTDSTADAVWASWTVGTDTTGTSTGNVWYRWAGPGTYAYQRDAQQPTPEQIAEDNRREQERIQRSVEATRKFEQANKRAEELLLMFLTPKQIEHLQKQSAFVVKALNDKLYRIRRGRSGNVDELDKDGKIVASYCAHPGIACPDADTMLTQKILLETDPQAFLSKANRSTRRAGQQVENFQQMI